MDEQQPNPTGIAESSPAEADGDECWADYYAATRDGPPRPLLVRAVALLPGPGMALDLGCGAGNDTRYLLAQGFHVTAVDADPAAVRPLLAVGDDRLKVVRGAFADFAFDLDGYDVISAQLALPFSPPDTFAAMFARVMGALRPGAIFTGHIFGIRDEWNVPGTTLSFHTRAEAEALLRGLDLLEFLEKEETVELARGSSHRAHAFEIIAQRPGVS